MNVKPKYHNLRKLKEMIILVYFDYDKIQGPITFRFRKDGDKFIPLGMTGNKKLKDLFMDLKIPKE